MIKPNTNIVEVLLLLIGKLCIASFLLVFLNFTITIQYVNTTSTAFTQVCEEEEEEEEVEETERDLNLHNFQFTINNSLLNIEFENYNPNTYVLMDYHTEVFTPPPEFI